MPDESKWWCARRTRGKGIAIYFPAETRAAAEVRGAIGLGMKVGRGYSIVPADDPSNQPNVQIFRQTGNLTFYWRLPKL
jgi:hypothetical protein